MKTHRKSTPPRPARLFREPERPADVHTANIDGASRGNPGPAAYAVVICSPDGMPAAELAKYIGRATNNVAEYYALITALDYAASHGIRRLRVRSDSELLVRQMQGRYKVKSPDLRPLHERAAKVARGLEYFSIEHVPRDQNARADQLANAALDTTGGAVSREAGASRLGARWSEFLSSHLPRPASIRARYVRGALVPAEPLDLPEGSEVEIEVRSKKQK